MQAAFVTKLRNLRPLLRGRLLLPGLLAWMLCTGILPHTACAEPDEQALGKAEDYPRGTPATMHTERFKVGSFSAADKILPSRVVERGSEVMPLVSADKPPEIEYRFNGARYTLDDYLERQRVTGLLVLQGNRILAERYRYGRKPQDRMISFSMAKSVVSLLVAIALEKKILASLDDPVEKYLSELKGSGYGQATIRQLLRMSSGVRFSERYDGQDDLARLHRAEIGQSGEQPLAVLASFTERDAPAGEKFHYASAETIVLGYVLARAAGQNLSSLTSQWIWQPLGAEFSAAWNLGATGQEQAAGGFNATLRDYGRLGLLLARDGRRGEKQIGDKQIGDKQIGDKQIGDKQIGDKQIVPLEYLLDATDVSRQPPQFRPGKATPYFGYGYQFWIFPMRVRTFALLGIFGQSTFVQPESQIVMVHLAVHPEARSPEANKERDALWRGVLTTLGAKTD